MTDELGSDQPPLYSNMVDMLDRSARLFGDRIFIQLDGERFSYAQVRADVLRRATGFRRHGIGKGDVVALLMDTCYDYVLCLFALGRIGAVSAPVNPSFKGEFLANQLNHSGSQAIIVDEEHSARLAGVLQEVTGLETIFHRSARVPVLDRSMECIPLEAVDGQDIPSEFEPLANDDLFALIYTSGTTGASKGCMISHNYMYNNGLQGRVFFNRDDTLYSPLPLFHINALHMICATCITGSTIQLGRRFSVSRFWEEIEESGATVCNLIGTMVKFLADAPESESARRCKGQLRLAMGVPFPRELQAVWKKRFGVARFRCAAFGQTEANLIASERPGETLPDGAAGRATDDFEVRIFGNDDVERSVGTVGEIVCRPRRPTVMFSGYWQDPEATLAAFGSLWFHTGDLGRIDADGILYFVDRKKDYIRRRGENISSFEVEATLLRHPEVAEAAATAVRSDGAEDDLKVTVVLHPGSDLDEAGLCHWLIDRMPYFAVPRFIEFRDSLPRNAASRIMKYRLREDGVTATTWDLDRSSIVVPRS